MSSLRRAAPAVLIAGGVQPGTETRARMAPPFQLKQADHAKNWDPRGDLDWHDYIETYRLDLVNIPPVLEPPRLVVPSLFQPIVRWGARQWQRGHINARPRFSERFVLVGHLVKQADHRRNMGGVPTRGAGGSYVYVYPTFVTGQRAVTLGNSGG